MTGKKRNYLLRMSGARRWALLGVALIIPAVQVAAYPSILDSEEPGVHLASFSWTESQLQSEWEASSPTLVGSEREESVSQQEIAVLISERESYKDLVYSLYRERLSNLVAGVLIGTLITMSVRSLFDFGGTAAVK